MTYTALYVYAIVPAGDYTPEVTGVDGLPVELVHAESGVSAVVHIHRAAPFEGNDDEVKSRIMQHGDVVEDCWQSAPSVLPVSFNVIVAPSEDGARSAHAQLRAWLDNTAVELTEELERLAGTSELRVGIGLDPVAYCRDREEIRGLETELENHSPGVRRLMSRRLETRRKELTAAAADDLYPDLRRRIATRCLDVEEQAAAADPGAEGVPVLSMSCLVGSEGVQELGQELADIRADNSGLSIRFLGPWPPYSFVTNSTLGS